MERSQSARKMQNLGTLNRAKPTLIGRNRHSSGPSYHMKVGTLQNKGKTSTWKSQFGSVSVGLVIAIVAQRSATFASVDTLAVDARRCDRAPWGGVARYHCYTWKPQEVCCDTCSATNVARQGVPAHVCNYGDNKMWHAWIELAVVSSVFFFFFFDCHFVLGHPLHWPHKAISNLQEACSCGGSKCMEGGIFFVVHCRSEIEGMDVGSWS